MRRIVTIALLSGFAAAAAAADDMLSVIPAPASVAQRAGAFAVSGSTAIVVDASVDASDTAAMLADLVERTSGLRLLVRSGAARDRAINLRIDASLAGSGKESYRVEVTPLRVTLSAPAREGLAHAATTLWQLMPAAPQPRIAIPAVTIDDAPRFAWRGMMLDSARHFQSPSFILRFLDAMAMHKLNVLHWHLTDDQAWRLEIRKYPKLTEVGAWRVPAGAGRGDIDAATGKPRLYGGFYSQSDVRAIVAHARARGITIVPEIDVPGHSSAMIAAYPPLGAKGHGVRDVPADWGVYPHGLNQDEATFAFVEDVFAEVIELFPGPYVHKGGDEVEHDPFTARLTKFLEARGRRLVGWDEILSPELPRSAVVMSWRGLEGALKAAASGHDTVLAPDPTLYFDNRQATGTDEPPGRIRVLASLESVYGFEPMPESIPPEARRHVLGLQGNVWTEHIRTEARVGYMTFPRAAAIAELGWSLPERRDWSGFARRVAQSFARYEAIGMTYSEGAFAVSGTTTQADGRARVELTKQAPYGDIRYTLDGSDPGPRSPRYAAPVSVEPPAILRAASFASNERLSRVRTVRIDGVQRRTSHELDLCGNAIALALEDDAPVAGRRAVFSVDIQNPCWIYRDADLDRVRFVTATVGQLPFNFQIGEDVKKIRFAPPVSREGELEVHLDTCEGPLLARLPLAPATASQAVSALTRTPVEPTRGRHDLCLRFAQPALEPMWVLDSIRLDEAAP
ncbi:MAG TPA: family 20 glycosylhydrolase [Usitatibacter sp.]|nr:family 20 glycosylhydrolase [Usitatibacter sp.]